MSSSSSPDTSTPLPPKSKQERIRDNQRRSRARRQEYLADLERRLSECQITCREADIQRAAFLELQIENAQLKEMLILAGVNEEFVDQYVSQAVAQSGQFPQESNPALRQLKPKIAPVENTRQLTMTARTNLLPRSERRLSSTINNGRSACATTQFSEASNMAHPSTSSFPSSSFGTSPISIITPTAPQWSYQSSTIVQSQQSEGDVICDAFGVLAKGQARPADDDAILCSVAKQMIDQYPVSPIEMASVMEKLSTGMCRLQYPGAGCAVDNQTLFQVLNDLSNRYS